MLKASLTVLLFLAASHASAQQIVRLQESPLPAESHPVRIDTDRALSVRHLASGEVLDCEGRCLLQMAAGDYALECWRSRKSVEIMHGLPGRLPG